MVWYVRPFVGLRPIPENAVNIVAPPTDVLIGDKAAARLGSNSDSFIKVLRPDIEYSKENIPDKYTLYKKSKEHFDQMIEKGLLIKEKTPCYYIYRLASSNNQHTQTGIVACIDIKAYEINDIKNHELTYPERVDERADQMDTIDAQIGPIFVSHKRSKNLDRYLKTYSDGPAQYDFITPGGTRHMLWVIDNDEKIKALSKAFSDDVTEMFICDGHHRAAAMEKVSSVRKHKNPNHSGDEIYNRLMVISFPDDQVQILSYNRIVADLAGMSVDEFLSAIDIDFYVEETHKPFQPTDKRSFGMFLNNKKWYKLTLKRSRGSSLHVTDQLSINILQENLLEPVLKIQDPRFDQRLGFIGGKLGLQELENQVINQNAAAAFSLIPVTMREIMDCARHAEVMPAKSTWFEPKPADGMISLILSDKI